MMSIESQWFHLQKPLPNARRSLGLAYLPTWGCFGGSIGRHIFQSHGASRECYFHANPFTPTATFGGQVAGLLSNGMFMFWEATSDGVFGRGRVLGVVVSSDGWALRPEDGPFGRIANRCLHSASMVTSFLGVDICAASAGSEGTTCRRRGGHWSVSAPVPRSPTPRHSMA